MKVDKEKDMKTPAEGYMAEIIGECVTEKTVC